MTQPRSIKSPQTSWCSRANTSRIFRTKPDSKITPVTKQKNSDFKGGSELLEQQFQRHCWHNSSHVIQQNFTRQAPVFPTKKKNQTKFFYNLSKFIINEYIGYIFFKGRGAAKLHNNSPVNTVHKLRIVNKSIPQSRPSISSEKAVKPFFNTVLLRLGVEISNSS